MAGGMPCCCCCCCCCSASVRPIAAGISGATEAECSTPKFWVALWAPPGDGDAAVLVVIAGEGFVYAPSVEGDVAATFGRDGSGRSSFIPTNVSFSTLQGLSARGLSTMLAVPRRSSASASATSAAGAATALLPLLLLLLPSATPLAAPSSEEERSSLWGGVELRANTKSVGRPSSA